VSREQAPPLRNKWTGQMLENREQICPACHRNFATTKAGDAHRTGSFESRKCEEPKSVGLKLTINKYNTEIWR